MSIDLIFSLRFFTTPKAVMLSVCTGVVGCLCTFYSSVCWAGTALRQLISRAPNSDSTAEDMTVLIIFEIVRIAPLLAGFAALSDMKNGPRLCCGLWFLRDTMRRCGRQGSCC